MSEEQTQAPEAGDSREPLSATLEERMLASAEKKAEARAEKSENKGKEKTEAKAKAKPKSEPDTDEGDDAEDKKDLKPSKKDKAVKAKPGEKPGSEEEGKDDEDADEDDEESDDKADAKSDEDKNKQGRKKESRSGSARAKYNLEKEREKSQKLFNDNRMLAQRLQELEHKAKLDAEYREKRDQAYKEDGYLDESRLAGLDSQRKIEELQWQLEQSNNRWREYHEKQALQQSEQQAARFAAEANAAAEEFGLTGHLFEKFERYVIRELKDKDAPDPDPRAIAQEIAEIEELKEWRKRMAENQRQASKSSSAPTAPSGRSFSYKEASNSSLPLEERMMRTLEAKGR